MSITNIRPGHSEPPAIPFAPRPKPEPPGPHQIGNVTLAAVDQLTDLSAVELDKLAHTIEDAGKNMAEDIRELARRLRKSGAMANANLSNFVRVAATVAESAREMAKHVDLRDEPAAEPPAETQEIATAQSEHLDKVQATIAGIISQSGAADHDPA